MGKITEYPMVNSLSDNDTLFVSKNGELRQIKKSDLNSGGGGGGIEKILDTTINITEKDIPTSGWKNVFTFEFTLTENCDVLIDIDNIVFSPLASGATFDICYFKMLCDGTEIGYDEFIGYYEISSKCHIQHIRNLASGNHTIVLNAVPKPSYVRLSSSVANIKVFAL